MNYDDVTEVTSTEVRLNTESTRQLLQKATRLGRRPVKLSKTGGELGNVSLSNLVIGEAGADWAMGIATARRQGPNLALVTQWVGEDAEHFARRVIARLAKRQAFGAVVLVCNDDNGTAAAEHRRSIVVACARLLPDDRTCPMTLICKPTSAGALPPWAPEVANTVRKHSSRLPLSVALAGAAA